jgi:hypothetical protein
MPFIRQLSNCRIYIHVRGEHPPPHIHAWNPAWEVVFNIRTFDVRRGSAPMADHREIRDWVKENTEFLLRRWEEINERD